MSVAMEAPSLANNALEEARSLLGMPIRLEQWNYEASRDSIRHYAWGIGDDNPLYLDPAYAAKTRWGTIIAPPTFMHAIHDAVIAPGLPDIQWFYAGADWTFDRPAERGDAITVSGEYVGVREVGGGKVKNLLIQTGDLKYVDQHGKRVAQVFSHTFRAARQSAEGGLKYAPREKHQYSRDELAAIERAVLDEYRRGAETLYWDDVKVGEALPGTVRGPLTQIDMTAYYAGAVGSSGYKSTKLRWQYGHWGRHHPEWLPNNYDASYFGSVTLPSIGHQDQKVATEELGMPGAYDNGPQRMGFICSAITNWMGDDGELKTYSIRLLAPVIFGDTNFIKGKVAAKQPGGLVEVEVWAENQLGTRTAAGKGTVKLPVRK